MALQIAPAARSATNFEIRSLRYFVAAAEELNFTRAAARLYVAQQALSREIQRLESRLGVSLFRRTTRRVTLTLDGERLLGRARDLVAAHDAVWAEVHASVTQPTVVDLMSEGRLTASRILAHARAQTPEIVSVVAPGPDPSRARRAGGGSPRRRVAGPDHWLDAELRCRRFEPFLVHLASLSMLLFRADHPLARHNTFPCN